VKILLQPRSQLKGQKNFINWTNITTTFPSNNNVSSTN